MAQPVTSTGASERLKSSTKSFFKVAPLLPPPPYTSEITILAEVACAVVAVRIKPLTARAGAMTAAQARRLRADMYYLSWKVSR